jgi:hypothetical protein
MVTALSIYCTLQKSLYYHLALCWKVAVLRIEKPFVDSSFLALSYRVFFSTFPRKVFWTLELARLRPKNRNIPHLVYLGPHKSLQIFQRRYF